ncbi:MAG TPA: L,D-transpeptidase family protein [Rhizomicrobium sp.]|nr:L,D-transpeptidase family protein [Rhizomicrobium sp.]
MHFFKCNAPLRNPWPSCLLMIALALATPAAARDSLFGFNEDDAASSVQDVVSGLDSDAAAGTRDGIVAAQVKAFYAARDFRMVWSGDEDASERLTVVRSALERADRQGLRPRDYISELSRWGDGAKPGRDAAEFDVTMTAALFRYALDVRLGRTEPNRVYRDADLPPQSFDVAGAFATALRRGSIERFLDELPPPHPGYRWLVDALARYRAIAEKGGWPLLSMPRAGGKHANPLSLALRLAVEDPDVEDEPAALQEALVRFQRRHGLDGSGKLDLETLKALNIPASFRVQQIIANMERWRWVPRAFEDRYILVNVPDQSLTFVANQTAKLSSKVVIGKITSPTPILRTDVVGVVANPAWDVPDDIAASKILPHLRHHPNYLASRNMVLANGHVEQNPGDGNVLGKLMLDSPNPFGVYMHDTPDKKLFLSTMREHSNGCVRVEQIAPLASLVLGGEDPEDRIIEAIATGETQELQLERPVAVYMLYWTAFADPDGAMEFRPDLYGRDASLIAKLRAQAPKAALPLATLGLP